MIQALDVMDACEVRPCSVAGVYIELDGNLSPKGQHGHLGMYQRDITPRHVYYVSGVGPDDCSWTPKNWIMSEWAR